MSVKIGMIHYNFAGTIDDFFKYCSETGFEYVELQAGSVSGDNPEQAAEELRKKVAGWRGEQLLPMWGRQKKERKLNICIFNFVRTVEILNVK